jgi:metallophosphoesterase superfamily enzyme
MTEVLFIGDLHLEKLSHFKWSYEQGLVYQFQALDRAYRYALNSGIEHIIVLGDIFETANPKQSTIHKLAISAAFKVAQWHNLSSDVVIELINEVINEIRFEKTKYIVAHIKEHQNEV